MDNKSRKKGQNARINKKKIIQELIDVMSETGDDTIPTDVDGSWTGVPFNEFDEPVQDADDL